MTGFPDTSMMPRSDDGSEPIRGGSIGFNRVLGMFEVAANTDAQPRFTAVIISAFTIFRNVYTTLSTATSSPSMEQLEEGFVKDVNLFLDYYDAYLSFVKSRLAGDKFCPVIIYFPDYHHVAKDIQREQTGKRGELFEAYRKFINRHGSHDGEVKKLAHCRCFWITAGGAFYPHKDVAHKFREIAGHPNSLYTSNDPICLITHMPLDLYLSTRLRNIQLLESHTARIRKPEEFKLKLDKEGRVPFQSSIHVTLGDDVFIKPMITSKVRKQILETAEKERWISRSADDVRVKVSRITNIPVATLRKYDFT